MPTCMAPRLAPPESTNAVRGARAVGLIVRMMLAPQLFTSSTIELAMQSRGCQGRAVRSPVLAGRGDRARRALLQRHLDRREQPRGPEDQTERGQVQRGQRGRAPEL